MTWQSINLGQLGKGSKTRATEIALSASFSVRYGKGGGVEGLVVDTGLHYY